MLSFLTKIFPPKPSKAAQTSYIALVAAARNHFFFSALGVPDTLDGRFELVALHAFFLQHRLGQEQPEFARELSECFFDDMDRSLRELGIGDTGVKRRVKTMAKAYHGRLQIYAAALREGDDALRTALARNLYGTVAEGDVTALAAMAEYVQKTVAALTAIPAETIITNQWIWPTP